MSSMPLRRGQVATIALGFATSLAAWLICCPWNTRWWLIGAPLGRDFVNFWMAPRLVLDGRGGVLTDLPAYGEAIRQTFGLSDAPNLVFVYPPHILLFLAPFAALPFLPAVLAWTALNLGLLAWTTKLVHPRSRPTLLLLACVSPPALVMVLYGHFGGLLALASTVAVMESGRRPWLSGLCLAVLTVKPQYAAALGLLLLCGGRWRCLLAAAALTAALVALSTAVFGLDPWRRFVAVTLPLQSAIVSEFRAGMMNSSISTYFAARVWGVPAATAWGLQGIAAAAALVAGVTALRRSTPDASGLLVVLLSALVMQPYVSHYDLAIVVPALTPLLLARGAGADPLASSVWVLMPLARILFIFHTPVLGLLVPAALLARARRLAGAAPPHRPTLVDGGLEAAA